MRRRDKRIFGAAALIFLLLLLAFKAGREGISNFYAQSAHLEIERWSQPGRRWKGDESTQVLRYFEKSLDYSPDNPWSLEELGTLQLSIMRASLDPQAAEAAARSANANLRKALIQRPTSPFVWANFALSKLYLGEKDEELVQALMRSEALGPWQPEVQKTVVFVGLSVWNRLNPAEQAAVVRAMERGARRDPRRMAELISTFGRIDLFCALRYSDPRVRDVWCQVGKTGKTPSENNAMKGKEK